MIQEKPNSVDIYVGNRVRLRRQQLQYSQQFLARKLGLTFQQLQKYEKASNRISASRLFDMSLALDVNMNYFFENMPKSIRKQSHMGKTLPNIEYEIMEKVHNENPIDSNKSIKLLNAFYKISNRKLADMLYFLILKLAKCKTYFPENKQK
ncbi:MAG: helix-turn-helix transcriptional regulator [Alphaproteobacteria bacterium]|nr:helix-turn-helix transcriptional regulator [Alphaproteobacteria bacterium]